MTQRSDAEPSVSSAPATARPWRVMRYLLALLAVLAAVHLRHPFVSTVGQSVPYLTAYPALMLIAFYLGVGPGVLASAVGFLVCEIWLVEAHHPVQLGADELLRGTVLFLSTVFLGYVGSALRRERVRTISILERVSDAFFALDRDWRFTYLNGEAEELLGAGRHLVGAYIWDCFPQAEGSIIHQKCREAVLEQKPVHFEAFYSPHGRWYEVHAYPDEKGISVYFQDVTQRKQAEDQLRESEERFRTLAGASFEGICISEKEIIRDCNDQYAASLGYRREELLGKSIGEVLPVEHRERILDSIRRGLEITLDYVLTCRDGTRRHIEAHGRTLNAHGHMIRISVTRDITARKLVEEELRHSREMFRAMGEAVDYGVWMCNKEGGVEYVSESFLNLLGVSLDEVRQFGWTRHLGPEDAYSMHCWLQSVRSGDLQDRESQITDRNGQVRTVLTRGKPVRSATGEVICWVGIHLDITDRKKAEQDRQVLLEAERAARGEAERLNRIKDEFVATVSHELRNPLNAILGWARLLARGKVEDVAHSSQIILRNASTLSQLVEDLLDMGRIVSGKIRLNLQAVDPEPLVRGVVESFQTATQAKNIAVIEEIEPHLGQIRCDPGRIQQIVWNLLSNAIKFTPAGGKVTVRVDRSGDLLNIQVADTGQGIAPDFLPHIFGKFLQADASTTRQHGGLGLGLSIVKYLAELHGGTVHAHSDGEGRGATITITLPIAIEPTANGQAEYEQGPETEPAVGGDAQVLPAGLTALVVDDDPDTCGLIARILHEAGVEALTATSAREGFETLLRDKPDLLISDVGMPEEDGYSLIRKVRSAGGWCTHMACLALTAMARAEDRDCALARGFDAHLAKPVDPPTLIGAIGELLMRSGLKTLERQKNREVQPVQDAERPAHSQRILLAEDHTAIAEMLKMTLESSGYAVSVADSVDEAVTLARQVPVDLLLSDLRLRDGTGWDLMGRLRQLQPVPGIAMSGFSDPSYVQRSKSAGFAEHLVKPLDEEILLATVRRVLSSPGKPAQRSSASSA